MMQPYLFPYIGYFQLIQSVDKFIFYDDVAFITRGWINRNNILLNHSRHMFTVPLHDASPNKLIKDVEISSDSGWKDKLLTTITHAYKKSPYFEKVFPLLQSLFLQDIQKISRLAKNSVHLVLDYLDMDIVIGETSSIYNNQHLKKEFRVVDITLKEKADTCIVPIGGKELYDKSFFETRGVELFYLKPSIQKYKQFYKYEFIPSLSIIDVLMFNSKEQVYKMINSYELI